MENFDNEIWKDIPEYEQLYQASNLGRIRSLDRIVRHNYNDTAVKKGKILKQSLNKHGYCKVNLCKNRVYKTFVVSRLVYSAFYGVIPAGMQVNHISEDKTDNSICNLNLMTPKENTNWGTCIERRVAKTRIKRKGQFTYETNPNSKPIIQYSKKGVFIKKWDCAKYAIEELNLSQSSLSSHLHNRTKSCGGFVFKFA